MDTKKKISIEEYLERVGQMVNDEYGRLIRKQFQCLDGSSELAMLETPSNEELEQLRHAVAIMTPKEKESAEKLTDEQILKIAEDARIDTGIFAIFINGYILYRKRVS
jgi:hypothetical protein